MGSLTQKECIQLVTIPLYTLIDYKPPLYNQLSNVQRGKY